MSRSLIDCNLTLSIIIIKNRVIIKNSALRTSLAIYHLMIQRTLLE